MAKSLPTAAPASPVNLDQLVQLARMTFETEDEGDQWLRRPHPLLQNQPPLTIAQTTVGAQRVRDMLVAIGRGGLV